MEDSESQDQWLELPELVEALGLNAAEVIALLREGRITHYRHQIDGKVETAVRASDVEAYMASIRVSPEAGKDAPPLDARTTPDAYGVKEALRRTRDVTPRSFVAGMKVLEKCVWRLANGFGVQPVGSARYVRFRIRGYDGTLYLQPQKRHVRLTVGKASRNVSGTDEAAVAEVIGWVVRQWGIPVTRLDIDEDLTDLIRRNMEREE